MVYWRLYLKIMDEFFLNMFDCEYIDFCFVFICKICYLVYNRNKIIYKLKKNNVFL